MAAAPAVAACLSTKAVAARTPTVRCSIGGVSPPPPSPRLTRRRNYLRQKLLKTLTKPSPEPLTLTQSPADENQIDVRDVEFEPQQELKAPDSEKPAAAKPGFDVVEESAAKGSEFVEASVSEGSSIVEASPAAGLGRVSAGTVVKVGACFVGIYILQAIVRAWVADSADSSDDKRRIRRNNREKLGMSENGNAFTETHEMKDGALLYLNEAEMEAKIAEIRMMAREAKERESKNSGNGDMDSNYEEDDSDDEVEDDNPRVKSGIEREIDGRLTRVRRGLDNERVNQQVIDANFLNAADVEKEKKIVPDEREEHKTLMFEKKYKFRTGDSSKPRDKPKGFQGLDRTGRNGSVSKKNGSDLRAELNGNDVKMIPEPSSQFQTQKKELEDESMRMDQQKGDVQDATNVRTQSNSRSKGNRVRSTSSTGRGDRKEVGDSSDLWWLKLPYLFAIAMQEGYDEEGERGFYSLKVESSYQSETQASYTVLFEDRGDAQNFCLILESCFEELEDINVFAIPLPMKDLNDTVKSQRTKVIVVRKGQLRLYAGQPLDEVETVLRSFIE